MKKYLLSVLLIISFTAPSAFAETRYIHDVLRVDMRSGPTTGHRIINFLKSGTPVEVISTSDDGTWTQIKARGKTGWVQTQYLTKNRVAKDLLKEAVATAESLKEKNRSLSEQLKATQKELNELKKLQSSMEVTKNQLQTKLEKIQRTAEQAIQTEKNHNKLLKDYEIVQAELENLRNQNEILKHDNLKDGIKWGAICVLIGVIIALLIPRMTARKRRSEW